MEARKPLRARTHVTQFNRLRGIIIMQQIKHMIEDGSVLFYIEDEESVTVLAVGNMDDFGDAEKNAAERYLEHIEKAGLPVCANSQK